MPSKNVTIKLELGPGEYDSVLFFNLATQDRLTRLVTEGGTEAEVDAVLSDMRRLPNMMNIYLKAWAMGYEAGKEDYKDA